MRGLPTILCASLAAGAANGGPPLLTEDSPAAGHRHLEIISAVSGTERSDNATLDATLLDLAYGLAPGFEIDATFSLTHDEFDDD